MKQWDPTHCAVWFGGSVKSWEFDCVWYNGDYWCVQCLPVGIRATDDEVSPIFADSELESAPECVKCGGIHDYMSLPAAEDTGNDDT